MAAAATRVSTSRSCDPRHVTVFRLAMHDRDEPEEEVKNTTEGEGERERGRGWEQCLKNVEMCAHLTDETVMVPGK